MDIQFPKTLVENTWIRSRFYAAMLFIIFFSMSSSLFAATVDVAIRGVKGDLKKNVEALLGIYQQRSHPALNEARIRRLHAKAEKEISSALQPFGYYSPVISPNLERVSDDSWAVTYTIDPGRAILVKNLDVQVLGGGATNPEFILLLEKLPLAVGKQLDHQDYDKSKNDLLKLAIEHGYFQASFIKNEVMVDRDLYVANIALILNTGPRYTFGKIEFEQNILKPEFISRFQPFAEGESYSIDKLLDLQQALNDSNYFQEVEVLAQEQDAEELSVPILVKLLPRKRHRYVFGLGYGTDTGIRGRVGWEMPRINRLGHRFDALLRATQFTENVTVNYRVPVVNPRTDQIIYTAGLNNEHSDTVQSTTRTLATSFAHARHAWRETISLSFQDERFEVADDSGRSLLLMPGIAWSRILWADDRIYPTRGIRFTAGLRGASSDILSDTDFAQAQAGTKFVKKFIFGRVIARANIGSTITPTFSELPPSVRFFTGGSETVRGYEYRSLGPVNADGEPIGGNHFVAGSFEYEQLLRGNWSAAFFYDAGDSMNTFSEKLQHGAGMGIRWKSPVGPIRLDVAYPLSQPEQGWRLHINIGPDL